MLCILMPAYNAEKYIAAAINSVFQQPTPIETRLMILDDGSTDRTADIIRLHMAQDRRISLIQTANRGVSQARNELIAALPSETRYVMFLDADDCLPADRITRDIGMLEQDPAIDIVYGQLCMIPSTVPNLLNADVAAYDRARHGNVSAGTYRRHIIDDNGPFDVSFTHGEDLDFILRMFERTPRAALLDKVSVLYRRHGEGATSDQAALRRGVMRATLLHIRRLRDDPSLSKVDTLFTQSFRAG